MGSVFNLSRVFRFTDSTGAPQISNFPDGAPAASNDLLVRTKHFTEIENFTFLGYVLAHELAGGPKPISTFDNLQVPDAEFQALVDKIADTAVSDEQLGDTLLDVGINWEHFVASYNAQLIPGDPLKITDSVVQEKIDSLDIISEALVREINKRSEEKTLNQRKQKD